jgi:hypothetical protein
MRRINRKKRAHLLECVRRIGYRQAWNNGRLYDLLAPSQQIIHDRLSARLLMLSNHRHRKLSMAVSQAEEMARDGRRVVWLHPKSSPPPPWAAERIRLAGVRIEAVS